MTNTRALALTIATFLFALLGAVLLWKAVLWTMNVDSETGKPVKTFVIHVNYGANEDQISCPGTPDRVLIYSPNEDGSADITCAFPVVK